MLWRKQQKNGFWKATEGIIEENAKIMHATPIQTNRNTATGSCLSWCVFDADTMPVYLTLSFTWIVIIHSDIVYYLVINWTLCD